MSLQPGRLVGPYEVVVLLGSGGMGEVWQARDSRLGRDVAMKTLPPGFAWNADRAARLTREARLLASLSHPNIATIHGLEEIDGERVLVMELVEGQTLDERMIGGKVPLEECLHIARQMAEALEAAHEKGIVHRDLKPANVVVSREGSVKLLDFGLAKALLEEPGDAWDVPVETPTQSAFATASGVVLGTACYMSPEQAQGKPVDRRADVWAFGVVLFEMLSGKRLFEGETVSDILASVLRQEIGWEQLPREVPPSVRRLLERCLERDPRERLRDLWEARIALEERRISREIEDFATLPPGRRHPRWTLAALSVVMVSAAAAVGVLAFGRRDQSPPARFDVSMPNGHLLQAFGRGLDISPDGRTIVFSAFTWRRPYQERDSPKLFLRPLDVFDARELAGTDGELPVFSPDGKWIAFVATGAGKTYLKKVPSEGGASVTICECDALGGVAWMGDGSLVFGSLLDGPLQRVMGSGGKPEPVTRLDEKEEEVSHRLPHVLPDGRTLLYTALRYSSFGRKWDGARIWAQGPGSEPRTLLVEGGTDAQWAPPGVVLFARDGTLMAARLSSSGVALTGPPVSVREGVRHSVFGFNTVNNTGAAQFAVSTDGRLVFAPGSVHPERQRTLVWVDEKGRETEIDVPKQSYMSMNVSPDGNQLLFAHNYPGQQIEVLDITRGTRKRVTFDGSHPSAIWGPGPGSVTFVSDHEGSWRIYSRRLDAPADQIETLWRGTGKEEVNLGSWSPDGKLLAFAVHAGTTSGLDIWLLPKDGEPRPFLATRFEESFPEISPDGRWLAYGSDEPGPLEVFVRPLDGSGASVQLSAGGGSEPVWARDGKAIFYKAVTRRGPSLSVFRVRVSEAHGSLQAGRPEKLFEGDYGSADVRDWDVAPDGRFLLDKPGSAEVRKNYFEQIYPDRIRVDLAGVPALLERVEKRN